LAANILLFCIWFWVSLALGNLFFGIKTGHQSFDIYRPFIEYLNNFADWSMTDKLWLIGCYLGIPLGGLGAYLGILSQTKCLQFLGGLSKPNEQEDVFGGAKEADLDDLKNNDLLVPRSKTKIKTGNKYLCYGELDGRLVGSRQPKNSCIFGKPGSGKGVYSVIPKLLDCPYPVVVNDTKFEITPMVVSHRWDVYGKKPYILDPFNVALDYNAKGWADHQTLHIDMNIGGNVDMNIYVSTLANAISQKDSSGKNGSFYDDAQMILEGVLYYLVSKQKNITKVFDMIVKDGLWDTKNTIEEFNETLTESSSAIYLAVGKIVQLHEKGSLTKYGADVAGILVGSIKLFGQSSLKQIFEKGDPERTLHISEYLAGNADIYMIVPPNMIEQTAPFIKLILGLVKSALEFANPQQLQSDYYPILLDEVAQLGYMKIIEQMYEVLRYKGIILWLYFQDMSQLKVFAKAAMFKSFDVLQFIGEINGDENIRFIKELAGTKTVKIESSGKSKSSKNITNVNSSTNKSISKTELLSTDFIRERTKFKQIIFYTGCPVIVCDRTKYYEHKRYKGLAGHNLTMRENSGLIPKDNEIVKLDILEKRKALKNKTKDNENNFEKEQTNELRSIDTGKFKNKLDEMLKNKDALLIPKGNYFYIDYATVKQLILDNYPDINLNDYIKSILDSDIIILEDVEGEHLYKLNLS
jgi:type IV secretory pathway TraG/TraD family ATPase VirD4